MFDHYMNIVKDHEWTEVNGNVGILSCECVSGCKILWKLLTQNDFQNVR